MVDLVRSVVDLMRKAAVSLRLGVLLDYPAAGVVLAVFHVGV